MKKTLSVLMIFVICTALLLTSLTPKKVYAVDPATAAAVAAAAAWAIQKAEDEGLFDCAFHLGPNQCRSIDRCNRARAVLQRAKSGNETALKELNDFINASDMQRNCVRSLEGGHFSALIENLQELTKPPLPRGKWTEGKGKLVLKDGKHHFRNAADTKWKDHYLDIDGNTGKVILWPTLGSGGYWKLTNRGNGRITLQNLGESKFKGYYLDIDGNTGEVILWPTLGSGGYWKLKKQSNNPYSLQNLGESKFKGYYLDIDGNTGEVILWPTHGSGGYWK